MKNTLILFSLVLATVTAQAGISIPTQTGKTVQATTPSTTAAGSLYVGRFVGDAGAMTNIPFSSNTFWPDLSVNARVAAAKLVSAYAGNTWLSGATPPRIVLFGDSYLEHGISELTKAFNRSVGVTGVSFFNLHTYTGGGYLSVTNWSDAPCGYCSVLPSGATDTIERGYATYPFSVDSVTFVWRNTGGAGTGSIYVSTNKAGFTGAAVATFSVNGASALGWTNVHLPLGAYTFKIVSSGGEIHVLQPITENHVGKGVTLIPMYRGSTKLADFTNTPSVVFSNYCAILQPDMVWAVNINDPGNWGALAYPLLKAMRSGATNMGILLIKPPYQVNDTLAVSSYSQESPVIDDIVRSNKFCASFDCLRLFGSDFTNSWRRGWMNPPPDIHPSSVGFALEWNAIIDSLGIGTLKSSSDGECMAVRSDLYGNGYNYPSFCNLEPAGANLVSLMDVANHNILALGPLGMVNANLGASTFSLDASGTGLQFMGPGQYGIFTVAGSASPTTTFSANRNLFQTTNGVEISGLYNIPQLWLKASTFDGFNQTAFGVTDDRTGMQFVLSCSNLITTVPVSAKMLTSTSGTITNGRCVWFDNTNNAPPNTSLFSFLATATNAPGKMFVGSNGVWFVK